MKKLSKLFVAATIVVAATTAVLVGCKKENQSGNSQGEMAAGEQPSEGEQAIINFLDNYKAMKRGEKTEGEAMSLEEARQMMETAINYY